MACFKKGKDEKFMKWTNTVYEKFAPNELKWYFRVHILMACHHMFEAKQPPRPPSSWILGYHQRTRSCVSLCAKSDALFITSTWDTLPLQFPDIYLPLYRNLKAGISRISSPGVYNLSYKWQFYLNHFSPHRLYHSDQIDRKACFRIYSFNRVTFFETVSFLVFDLLFPQPLKIR